MPQITIKNINKNKGIFRIEGTDINLTDTFDCGQCFRWNLVNGKWEGIAYGRFVRLEQCHNGFIIENTNLADIKNVWILYLDLERDYKNIAKEFDNDLFIKTAADYGKGIHILKQEPIETIYSFIISANNNIARIKKIVERFCALAGKEIYTDGDVKYSFPSPDSLKSYSLNDYAPLNAGFRDKYLLDCTSKLLSEPNFIDELKQLDTDSAREKLKSIKGIGNKVADCILLFAFQRFGVFPKDVWINRVTAEMYGEAFDEKNLGEYAGVIQQYMFYYGRSNPEMLSSGLFYGDVKVHCLRDCPQFTEEVAAALYKEFARASESPEFFSDMVKNGAEDYDLPLTIVAEINGIFAGAVILCRSDLLTRQDLTPWLALLYVKPQFRNRHYGALLQEECINRAKDLGYSHLYLYTDLINYYDKTGWVPYGEGRDCDGSIKQLYYHDLK